MLEVWKDPENLVIAKLRLYRKYSIKLMLAWETCCRFPYPYCIKTMLLTIDDMSRYSFGVRHPILLPTDLHDCGRARLNCVYLVVVPANHGVWTPRSSYQKKMPCRLRFDGMDEAEVWHHHSLIFEPPHVGVGPKPWKGHGC